ncbi:hypothetical protein OJF2_02730 [Aquisphaera giovannonii]|uniref:Uncharacterized protein n=1 Tax=Aquisphaera giovannonii TaxID=406548 RepID=A0A5B9VU87_9BACT|nr:hypothetical protein [Aquisphaera giovannonii]QEH31808.1 hypothetical protein OJF2_02730 [Aquisphaera giovannonii]
MHRSITVLFRRDASRDRRRDRLQFAGYRMLWPDGREIAVGLDAFCRYGQRLLGLDRHLAGVAERLIEILCFPVHDPDGPMTRLPGHRVRRFFLHRDGPRGRLHFLDGTPTEVDFVLGRDEPSVVEWIGLADAPNRASVCLDLAARPAAAPPTATASAGLRSESKSSPASTPPSPSPASPIPSSLSTPPGPLRRPVGEEVPRP